jgi:hypothetical protein
VACKNASLHANFNEFVRTGHHLALREYEFRLQFLAGECQYPCVAKVLNIFQNYFLNLSDFKFISLFSVDVSASHETVA